MNQLEQEYLAAVDLVIKGIESGEGYLAGVIEVLLIKAIKAKHKVSDVNICRFQPDRGGYMWMCTIDPAYEHSHMSPGMLDHFLDGLQEGVGIIEFLDTSKTYSNLDDLRHDILTVKLAQL